MDNYGTVDNPAWITTVFCALMHATSTLTRSYAHYDRDPWHWFPSTMKGFFNTIYLSGCKVPQ